jgi:spermidine synthase
MKITDSWDEALGRTISIDGKLIKEVQSKYQNIKVYDTKSFGKLLQLDGVIQLTEFDEANYHEMLAHVPLMIHKKPERVLVIGGGDGGIVREIVKHKRVTKIDLVEIDEEVIKISKEHFPNISSGFKDPRVTIHFDDGAEYIGDLEFQYDVIIIDSTDPFSVGASLFTEKFYEKLTQSVREHGIIVSQSESMFYNANMISDMKEFKTKYFRSVEYYYTMVPTYPSGTIGFQICSDGYHLSKSRFGVLQPGGVMTNWEEITGLKYYNFEIHKSSFILPNGVKQWHT